MPPKSAAKKGEPAAKRVKTAKAATKPATKTRGKKGRLSVLPTLPLDVLYEVFAHLGPGDLISLARTSKGFRNVLLSRQSAFLWREVLGVSVEEGFPPKPEDMTEPAWAGFFFGGSYCSLCAAKTTLEVCWVQRRRLCRGCAETHLIPIAKIVDLELMSPEVDWSTILSVDDRRPLDKEGLDKYDRNSKIPHAYVEDVEAYEAKLKELYDDCDGDKQQWEQRRVELDTELKAAVAARWAHSRLCIEWESTRLSERSRELSDTRRDRGKEIFKRLLALGYERQDVTHNRLREHKDFRDAKPLTEKIWKRIQPGLIQMVERIHADRLRMQMNKRQRMRQEAVRIEYVELILRRVHHSVVPFMPPLDNLYELFPDVKAVIEPDGEVTDELRSSIREALPSGLPALQHFITERGSSFRRMIPAEWLPSQDSTPSPAEPITTPEQLSVMQIADLDRAAYVTRCKEYTDPRHKKTIPIHFGLDALADFCDRNYEYMRDAFHSPQVVGVAFEQACHDTVVHLCQLLGLDAGMATPLDLDTLNRAFVCVKCYRDTGGAVFMTWRDAVAHADPNRGEAHTSKRPTFRLASEIEKRYLKAHLERRSSCDEVWGCMYCSDHLAIPNPGVEWFYGFRDSYMSLEGAMKHMKEKHNKSTVIEGEDTYFRRKNSKGRFVHLPYWKKAFRIRELRTVDDVVLPVVDSEETLLALVVAKETQNEQQEAAEAAHLQQLWGPFDDSD